MNKPDIYSGALIIEKEIRASMAYHDWVKIHKASQCIQCNSKENLNCHHIPSLMTLIREYYKVTADWQSVKNELINWHTFNMFDPVTLCSKCHSTIHMPTKKLSVDYQKVPAKLWTAIPRNFNPVFAHSTQNRIKGSIGLVAMQTVIGLGWYILNGYLDSRMLTFHRRRFAELLYKTPGSSFNHSLDEALNELTTIGVIAGKHIKDNNVELHIEKDFLKSLHDNPWFIPIEELETSNMCTLALRLRLLCLSKRTYYSVGIDKLRDGLHIRTQQKFLVCRAIRKAMKEIKWAKMKVENDMFSFQLQLRGAPPIASLRHRLQDSIASSS